MIPKTTSEIVMELTELYNQLFIATQRRRATIDNKNRVLPGKEKEEQNLRETVKQQTIVIQKLLEDWINAQLTSVSEKTPTSPSRPPIFEPNVEVDFSLVKDAFPVDRFSRAGYINVPMGQVYVFGHQSIDDVGFPEVYLGGEVVLSKNKDKHSLVAVLAQSPGEIRCIANQWLAGISVSKDNPSRISIRLPVHLHDPRMTLMASRGSWLSEDGRKNINHDIHEQLIDQFQEMLSDRIQLWSAEKRDLYGKMQDSLGKYLESWGLCIIPELVSIVRQYPKNLYEIVLQFAKAEQFILDTAGRRQKSEVFDQWEILPDELTYIEASARQSKSNGGEGLFQIIKDKKLPMLSEKPELRAKFVDWLRIHGGANAANYVSEIIKIYISISKTDNSADRDAGLADIRLSEQIITHAFRNPIIGLGEWLETLE